MNNKKEIINYLIFGFLTTIINIIVYAFFANLLNIDYKISTTIAWIISVLFAFFTNKKYVFKSQNRFLKELVIFFCARLLSYVLDILGMILLVQFFSVDDVIAKVIVNFFVILVNYFISKLFIFK